QARAVYQIRRADQWPSVGVGASASRAAIGNGVATVYSVGFAVASYELDLFGRVHDLSEAALAQYFATAETRKAVQISLISSVGRCRPTCRRRCRSEPNRSRSTFHPACHRSCLSGDPTSAPPSASCSPPTPTSARLARPSSRASP